MFGKLTEKFQDIQKRLRTNKQLTESNIADAVRSARLALLDADVNYTVVKRFILEVKAKALGTGALRSVKTGDQFIHILHEELVQLMGGEEATLALKGLPSIVLLCGLQGSGKTTQAAKLAFYLKKQKKKALLVACDVQRPAAIEQLHTLGGHIDVPVFSMQGEKNTRKIAKVGVEKAKKEHFDVVIVDTAGRLHIDELLMEELEQVKKEINPHEILFVASAATGQDAVKTAAEFDKRLSITGSILTMLDGGSRAGAAISIKEVTGKPLKFEGVGEKVEDLQLFNPHSMADRILGMGDVINLVKKAKEQFHKEDEALLEKKLRKSTFHYQDYLDQMAKIKKMGSLKSLLKMMPGMDMSQIEVPEKDWRETEAIIRSMTLNERMGRTELLPARRRRIAKGSGTSLDAVNRLVKGFKRAKQMMKSMPSKGQLLKKGPAFLKNLH